MGKHRSECVKAYRKRRRKEKKKQKNEKSILRIGNIVCQAPLSIATSSVISTDFTISGIETLSESTVNRSGTASRAGYTDFTEKRKIPNILKQTSSRVFSSNSRFCSRKKYKKAFHNDPLITLFQERALLVNRLHEIDSTPALSK